MDPDLLRVCQQLSINVGGALAAKPLLEKLLGPSFEYVGKAMADLLGRYGNKNVHDIFCLTATKVPEICIGQSVNPRVLRTVIEEGSFIKDDVAKEYFAGLLAASLTGDVDDDEAITLLTIVKNLTSAQIKTHHLFYSLMRLRYMADTLHSLPSGPIDVANDLFVPSDLLQSDAGINDALAAHQAVRGLAYHGLIGNAYEFDSHYFVPSVGLGIRGAVMQGTHMGAELFLWVHGRRDHRTVDLWSANVSMEFWVPIQPLPQTVLNSLALSQQRQAKRLVGRAMRACKAAKTHGGDITALMVTLKELRETSLLALPLQAQEWVVNTLATNATPLTEIEQNLRDCWELLEGSFSGA